MTWPRRESLKSWRNPVRIGRAARIAGLLLGKTASGRYLRVIYVPDPEPDSVFVITSYELIGKPLAAYRRRRKKKHQ
jgi:hypothetical protein